MVKIEQKCLPTITEVPHKKCTPRYERKCVTDYKTVDKRSYKEECHEDIQHVCEKLVEVPVAAEVSYPVMRTEGLRPQYENVSQQKQAQLKFTDPQSQTSVNHSDKPVFPPHLTKYPKYRKELLQSKSYKPSHSSPL